MWALYLQQEIKHIEAVLLVNLRLYIKSCSWEYDNSRYGWFGHDEETILIVTFLTSKFKFYKLLHHRFSNGFSN